MRKSTNADRLVDADELDQPDKEEIETHRRWIQRLTQWKATEKANPQFNNKTLEELKKYLGDFGPVFDVVNQIRECAQNEIDYLKKGRFVAPQVERVK